MTIFMLLFMNVISQQRDHRYKNQQFSERGLSVYIRLAQHANKEQSISCYLSLLTS